MFCIAKIDLKHSIIKCIETARNVLNAHGIDENQDLIGNSLHGLGFFFDNLEMLDEAIEFYQCAINYKKMTLDLNQRSIMRAC